MVASTGGGPAPPADILRAKVAVLGDPAVGKTCLCKMFKTNKFPSGYKMTTTVDYFNKQIRIPDTDVAVELHFYDMAGSDLFVDALPPFLDNLNLVFVVFDIANRETFESCAKWLEMARGYNEWKGHLTGVLVGNKLDLHERRQVQLDDALAFAQQNGLEYFETASMPPGRDVDSPFNCLAAIYATMYHNRIDALAQSAASPRT